MLPSVVCYYDINRPATVAHSCIIYEPHVGQCGRLEMGVFCNSLMHEWIVLS